MTDWIDVNERLPEKSGWYLTTVRYNGFVDLAISWFLYAKDFSNVDNSQWRDLKLNPVEAVVAWMPLPEPYQH